MKITAFFEGVSAKKLRFSFQPDVRESLTSYQLPAACLQRLPAEYLQRLPADFCRFQRAVMGAAGAVELTGLPYDERGFIATLAARLERDHGDEIREMSGQNVALTLSFRLYEYEQSERPFRGRPRRPSEFVGDSFTANTVGDSSAAKQKKGAGIVGVAVVITDIVPL